MFIRYGICKIYLHRKFRIKGIGNKKKKKNMENVTILTIFTSTDFNIIMSWYKNQKFSVTPLLKAGWRHTDSNAGTPIYSTIIPLIDFHIELIASIKTTGIGFIQCGMTLCL